MKKRLVSILCVVSMVAGLLAGCGSSTDNKDAETKDSNKESVFTAAISYVPDSLAPTGGYDDLLSMIRPIYEPMFAETEDGFYYFLADSVKISDDGTTYTIHFNDKANWSDGEPVGAEDAIFTVNYYKELVGESSPYSYILGKEVTYTVLDDKTLEVKLPMAYNSFIAALAGIIPMPAHAFDNDATKVDGSDYFKSTDMATSGAYTVAEINEDSFVYVKKDDYYRGTPSIDKVIMKTIGSGSTKQVAFENGEISYMNVTSAADLEKYENDKDNYNVYSIPQARCNFLMVNPKSTLLASEEARKAVFLALNVDEMVEAAYGSELLGTVATQYLTPQQSLYDNSLKGYEQNLEEAKTLAKEAGLEGATLTYVFNSERSGMEEIATVVQQQLAKIGITVNIEATENATFLQKWGEASKSDEASYDLITQGYGELRGSSAGTWGTLFGLMGGMLGFHEDVQKTALALNATTDEAQAKTLATQMQEAALNSYVMYPISNTNYVMVSHKNVTGLDGCPLVPEFMDYLKLKID